MDTSRKRLWVAVLALLGAMGVLVAVLQVVAHFQPHAAAPSLSAHGYLSLLASSAAAQRLAALAAGMMLFALAWAVRQRALELPGPMLPVASAQPASAPCP